VSQFELYNAADDLLGRNLKGGHGDKVAVIDRDGTHTYAALADRVDRFASLLRARGLAMEQRVLLCLLDTVDFPTCFLGAIKAGLVPVPVSTMLTPEDYAYLLADSRARMLVVSEELSSVLEPGIDDSPFLDQVLVAGGDGADSLSGAIDGADAAFETAPTRPDDVAFWLYTSGTTGKPKGAMHVHSSLGATAQCYAGPVLGLSNEDIVFSAAKLFFAYGLGNALTFPFSVGATAVLLADRPTPEAVLQVLSAHRPTLFFGVPTLYAMMLNAGQVPSVEESALRLCVSAGEALPENLLLRWREQTGVDILDGIGSTEMLHIFMSNRVGEVKPGTSGVPVAGYQARLLDENRSPVADGEIGDLYVSGPSSAIAYWNLRNRSRRTFQGDWTLTGDKYLREADGSYRCCGRSDDMLKVGGIFVSPVEVENALMSHPKVAEAAVVGAADRDRLIKPKAFVVLGEDEGDCAAMADELIAFVRERLADYKRPRWVEFVTELPKTATGKIQRYKLR